MKEYIKKIIVSDEKATPEARAKRLKRVRNLANLSRQDICNDGSININTYKGWEIGRYGGLPRDGAEKIIQRVAKEGVVCSLNWLLYEIGIGPYIISNFRMADAVQVENNSLKLPGDENFILQEIALFKKNYHDVLDCKITDDTLLPLFRPGDYVAGVQLPTLQQFHDESLLYIVLTLEGKTLVRKLKKEADQQTFRLSCVNLETTSHYPVEYNRKLTAIAPVIRWYRRFESDDEHNQS